MTGYRVARVLTDVGAYVRRGQTLVELDGALIRSQVAQQSALARTVLVSWGIAAVAYLVVGKVLERLIRP